MVIRDEKPSDREVISDGTSAAFRNLAISNHTEQFIIRALRDAGALTVSLVAEMDGRVVGHIAFSPVTISDGSSDWYGLGPISVLPECRRQDIDSALMREGLAIVKSRGGKGCALVGDPRYYKRFGCRNDPDLIHKGIPQEVFLVLPFGEEKAGGTVDFHAAFQATG